MTAASAALDLASAGLGDALAETLDHLGSEAAEAAIRRDPYWPKWETPWWRMTLLHELGLARQTPARAVRAIVEALNRHYIRFFPFVGTEIPPGIDPVRQIPCHCQLGTMAQVLHGCGVDVDAEVGWIRPWLLRYQLPDGGLNCDEAAYGRPAPHASIVSTLPAVEAILCCTARAFTAEEERFLARAAGYLLRRRLARSVSKGMRLIDPAWLVPCFPRFYEYDVLRGLRFVARWAARTGATLPEEDVAEAVAALDSFFAADDPSPRRPYATCTTYAPDASGTWRWSERAGTFPLLDCAASAGVSVPLLRREWVETRALLARPGGAA